jgi:hypothetical protein
MLEKRALDERERERENCMQWLRASQLLLQCIIIIME